MTNPKPEIRVTKIKADLPLVPTFSTKLEVKINSISKTIKSRNSIHPFKIKGAKAPFST